MTHDLFGPTSNDPIVGLPAMLPDRPCRQCGSISAVIESTGKAPHHGSPRCDCGQFGKPETARSNQPMKNGLGSDVND